MKISKEFKQLILPVVVGQSEQLCDGCGTKLAKGLKNKCYKCYELWWCSQ